VPLALPRAHDCITLLLGSHERYMREFDSRPGTYYSSAGWHERDTENLAPAGPTIGEGLGIGGSFEEYAALYGEENARYIVEQLKGGLRHYDRLVFVESGLGGELAAREAARARAGREGWAFEVMPADLSLLERLVSGDWARGAGPGREGLLVVPPGGSIEASNDEDVMRCVM
jgi:hypothetical protein